MASFFSSLQNEVTKLVNTVTHPGDALAAGKERTRPRYEGRLNSSHLQLGEGVPLGLEGLVAHTIAFEPQGQLLAICTREGQVRLLGQELELVLQNPAGSFRSEFLLFPRPGLLLAIGVAAQGSTWFGVWWDLRRASSSPSCGAEVVAFRFGVVCAAPADESTGLVFLGTDEGDVRVFDAGDTPGMGEYCVPSDRLRQEANGQPCPVLALAPARGVPELLIGTAEGLVLLWSLEQHKVLRSFGPVPGPVTSLIWQHCGAMTSALFLAALASRGDLYVFARENATTAPISRLSVEGGPTSTIAVLSWTAAASSTANQTPGLPECGEIVVRRGSPAPAVLRLWGNDWSQCENLFAADVQAAAAATDTGVVGAALCIPTPCSSGMPCGCPAPLASLSLAGLESSCAPVFQELSATRMVVAVLGDAHAKILVRSLCPTNPKIWTATWGSLELAGATALELVPRSHAKPRPLPSEDRARTPSPDMSSLSFMRPEATECEQQGASCGPLDIVADGNLQNGAEHMPDGHDSEPMDGWLICAAGDPPESDSGPCTDEGVRWRVPPGVASISSKISFGYDARARMVLWRADREECITFDSEQQSVAWDLEGSEPEDRRHGLEIEPGEEHMVIAWFEKGCFGVRWNGATVVGPVPLGNGIVAFGWRCADGELRIQSMVAEFAEPAPIVEDQTQLPAPDTAVQANATSDGEAGVEALGHREHDADLESEEFDEEALAEEMYSHRVAHFASLIAKQVIHADPRPFVNAWHAMDGGWNGMLCSGHRDGTIRVWLRGHAAILLLYTASIKPLAPLPWRPQVDLATAMGGESTGSPSPWARMWLDGVDACPAVAIKSDDDVTTAHAWAVTAVVLDATIGVLAAGTASGRAIMFRWRSSSAVLPVSELAALHLECQEQLQPRSSELVTQAEERPMGSEEPPAPQLPAGLICVLRSRQHHAPVRLVRVVKSFRDVGEHARRKLSWLRLVTSDAASNLCVMNGFTGELLFSGSLSSMPREPLENSPGAAPPPPPPADIVDAVEFCDTILHVAPSTPAGKQVATAVGFGGQASPQQGAVLAAAKAAAAIAAAADDEANEGSMSNEGAYILAMSSGELRQLKSPEMRVLDNRIRETKLPQLCGGRVLALHIDSMFLLVVQPTSVQLFPRQSAGGSELGAGISAPLSHRAVAANIVRLHGELCAIVLTAGLSAIVFALPSLWQVATLDVGAAAHSVLQSGSLPSASWLVSEDGYALLQIGVPGSKQLWYAPCTAASSALDAPARALVAAQLAQAAAPATGLVEQSSPTAGPAPTSSNSSRTAGGMLRGLFGAGGGTPKTMRACVAPGAPGRAALPQQVDGNRIDRNRGIPPAWRDPRTRPPPPPPSTQHSGQASSAAPSNRDRLFAGYTGADRAGKSNSSGSVGSSAASAASNARAVSSDLAQAHRLAAERGEKVSQLADKSQKMMEDSNKFLDLARQLNAKQQNRWF